MGLHAGQVRLSPSLLQGNPRGDLSHPPRERHGRLPGEEVLAGSQCIEGNVSSSLLAAASADEVEAYSWSSPTSAEGAAGFIMDHSAFMDEAKRENVKKMIEVAKRYGR